MPAPHTTAFPRGAGLPPGRAQVSGARPTSPRPTGAQRRALLGNAVVALLIAALGLVAAASLSLTTNAQASSGAVRTITSTTAADDQAAASQPARSAALRTALTREVAAERADQLAKTAETVDRSAREASGNVRQQGLTQVDRSTQAAASQIAQQRLQAAIAARQAAQDAAVVSGTLPVDATPVDPTDTGTAGTLPAGTTGVLPVPGGVIGSRFGEYGHWSEYHTGLDFRAAIDTPIRAVLPGVVLYAGNSGDWAGNHVAIRHADGQTTMYCHMSSMAATAGQTVQAGQVIGYVGQTGRAFGPHLHFELYPVGVKYGDVYKAIDPAPWLRSIGVITH